MGGIHARHGEAWPRSEGSAQVSGVGSAPAVKKEGRKDAHQAPRRRSDGRPPRPCLLRGDTLDTHEAHEVCKDRPPVHTPYVDCQFRVSKRASSPRSALPTGKAT